MLNAKKDKTATGHMYFNRQNCWDVINNYYPDFVIFPIKNNQTNKN